MKRYPKFWETGIKTPVLLTNNMGWFLAIRTDMPDFMGQCYGCDQGDSTSTVIRKITSDKGTVGRLLTFEEAKAIYKKIEGKRDRVAWWGIMRHMLDHKEKGTAEEVGGVTQQGVCMENSSKCV